MTTTQEIAALMRDRAGKGAARAVRRQGNVPAVIYGAKEEPVSISVSERVLQKAISGGRFLTTLFMVDVDGTKTRCIPRDIQYDPVSDRPLHVDFMRLGEGARIDIEIPVRFLNELESPGLKRGGVLNIVRHEVELNCSADAIPGVIEADLTGLDINDSIHISDIKLPEGVVPVITDRDFTIATIGAPSGMAAEEDEAAEGEGVEGIEGEEGEEGEAAAAGEEDAD